MRLRYACSCTRTCTGPAFGEVVDYEAYIAGTIGGCCGGDRSALGVSGSRSPTAIGTGSCIRVEPPIGVAAGDGAGCEVRGPYVAEAGRFGQAISRMFLRLRRSLRLARFMAMVMRGAAILGKPAGSPRLRSVIRVERSLMACQV